ncbi:MAG: UDP-3-O-(3-hydroxymyristoyl)glucosamine N-acyltransferase [Bacteroidetes bacterium HGW-Bacteroidetes-1]|jgi:UDP-3-O-[3-hydroxymyristoyl] glucosamine N-acyltransferase|nr:MAG: UDP-3-O-(3-hydroxymyristoyl)glucosamine N-acyltransferase [Bacteroidetes bacterium HGW-Bacteroidetes-1]
MEFSAQQIAELLSGTVEGNPDIKVSNIARIEGGQPGTLTFLANPKYTPFIYETKSSIVIVNNGFLPEFPIHATLIRVADSYSAFAQLLEWYQKISEKSGVSSLAYIAADAKVGEDGYVGEFAFIGEKAVIGKHVKIFPQVYVGDNCEIGDDTIIYPGVKLYGGTKVGKKCILHAGCVLGSDGFGFAVQQDQQYKKVPQTGIVVLEDYVEIGANTTIDRATLGETIIRKGVKLDNLIQVAHNVEIGENTVIAAQTGISGSTKIGSNCMFGGQVGLAGHIVIADGVKIAAQSGVGSHIREKDSVLMGSPAFALSDFKRSTVHFKRLDQMAKKIAELEEKVSQLSNPS